MTVFLADPAMTTASLPSRCRAGAAGAISMAFLDMRTHVPTSGFTGMRSDGQRLETGSRLDNDGRDAGHAPQFLYFPAGWPRHCGGNSAGTSRRDRVAVASAALQQQPIGAGWLVCFAYRQRVSQHL